MTAADRDDGDYNSNERRALRCVARVMARCRLLTDEDGYSMSVVIDQPLRLDSGNR